MVLIVGLVVLEVVRIVGLVVLQVVQADPKVGFVHLEMVRVVSIMGLMVCLVEFILQLIIAFVVVVVFITECLMKKMMFYIKVRFCSGNIVIAWTY